MWLFPPLENSTNCHFAFHGKPICVPQDIGESEFTSSSNFVLIVNLMKDHLALSHMISQIIMGTELCLCISSISYGIWHTAVFQFVLPGQ